MTMGPQPMPTDHITTPKIGRRSCFTCGMTVIYELGYKQAYCMGCAPCDECGHRTREHASLHDKEDQGLDVDWSTATCWGSSECAECRR